MNINMTNLRIISLCITMALVLGLFVGMPITASAAPIGLSSPNNVHWDGDTAVWDGVPGAVEYGIEMLYREDANTPQDPDADELMMAGWFDDEGTGTSMRVDLSGYFDKSGAYYFIVCALDDPDANGIASWAHSGDLLKTITPPPGGSSGSSGGRGGSSGGGSSTADGAKTSSTSNASTSAPTTISSSNISATSRGTGEVTVQAGAWSKLSNSTFLHDTVANGVVQVRVIISNPAAITNDLKVSAYTSGTDVERVTNLFNRAFSNNVSTVHFDQTGSWGQEVRIAAKFNLTGMNTDNLVFYAYDRASNTYQRISAPNYTIDANGYTHFSTPYAGDIVVSNGALVKK